MIAALEQQAYPSDAYEVIVISDGSTDGTDAYLEALRSTMRLRWFPQANRGPSAARNTGIQKADGKFIVFIDDDVVPAPQLLGQHARSHDEAGQDVVVLGPLLTPEGFEMTPWVRWEQEMLMKKYRALLRGDLANDGAPILHGQCFASTEPHPGCRGLRRRLAPRRGC